MRDPDLVLVDRKDSKYHMKLTRGSVTVEGSGPGYLDTYYKLLDELKEKENGAS